MRYVTWVESVLGGLAAAEDPRGGGVGLAAVAEKLGLDQPDDASYRASGALGHALMTAMYDLDALGVVSFENYAHSNRTTRLGREALDGAMPSIKAALFGLHLTDAERRFLARLYETAAMDTGPAADLAFVDTEAAYAAAGLAAGDAYDDKIARARMLRDLEDKHLVRAETHAMGNESYRPTYAAAVILTEPDPSHEGLAAGVIDWTSPAPPGFEEVEGRLADLKVRLAAANTHDDLSDIGNRCRDNAADAVDAVFRDDMVPEGEPVPSRQDAEGRLRLYLAHAAPGEDNEALRSFLKAALKLANARTHSARTGVAAAVAAAQGLISFVRTLEAIERARRA